MNSETTEYTCLNCGESEQNAPLVAARYSGETIWICANCMPVLIHKSHMLVEKLATVKHSAEV